MKIGLIGLNQTGKTTLFNLLTGRTDAAASGGKSAANIGTGAVPDERVDFLASIYKPKKTTYAKLDIIDVAGFSVSTDGHSSGAAVFLNDVRPCDALVHVLRAFDSPSFAHEMGEINPARDLEAVESEMLMADLEMIEKRIGRIKTGKKITKENEFELALLERSFKWLDEGGSILNMDMTDEERLAVKSFTFLTEKPRIAVANLDESQWESKSYPNRDGLKAMCERLGVPLIELCVETELEITRLPEEDKQMFMEEMAIEQPGIAILANAVYDHLGLMSFLTSGEDECRAWTLSKGTIAKHAAGKIHSDIERGFIRAEVVKYDSIKELGSMAKVKEKGLFRLEGKEYIVQDGDIISFRFNV
ncbi:MAG: redox-regulated ATPase YchF [Oscillospiraceae bacterium]|nr:redox-regulated ATPase YchF [Oscillospiraceae bacterium]